jgi:hypothetical protein
MPYTELIGESLAVAADGIHAASQSTAEKLTAAVDLSKWRKVFFLIDAGVLGTSATLDFQIKGSTAVGGTYTAISGTAITQLVKATDDGKYAVVTITAEKVWALGLGYKFVKGSLLPGTNASLASVHVLGESGRFEPVVANDATAVAQVLNVWR